MVTREMTVLSYSRNNTRVYRQTCMTDLEYKNNSQTILITEELGTPSEMQDRHIVFNHNISGLLV